MQPVGPATVGRSLRGRRVVRRHGGQDQAPFTAGDLLREDRQMKTLRFGTSLQYLVVTALVVLAPCLAHAGLLGDTVSATLTDVDSGNDIFSGSKVVGAGAEFSANFTTNFQSTWTLDLTDTGFTLTGTCSNDNLGCDFVSGLTLSISDLDFTPPADLTGLSGVTGITLPGLVVGTP